MQHIFKWEKQRRGLWHDYKYYCQQFVYNEPAGGRRDQICLKCWLVLLEEKRQQQLDVEQFQLVQSSGQS
jgi:hypothetical protein